MTSAELIISTDVENQALKEITFNFEEIKAYLDVSLEKYKGLVVTEDAIADAKADRAKLNNLEKAIDAKRLEIKKQCMAPYEDFEKKVKVLTGSISQVSGDIDKQIKAFERQEAEKKKDGISAIHLDFFGDLAKLVPLEKIWNEKWLNKGYAIAKIETEITTHKEQIQQALAVLENETEYKQQMIDKYLLTLDLTQAMAEKARLEAQQRAKEEYEKAKAAESQATPKKPDYAVFVSGGSCPPHAESVKKPNLTLSFFDMTPDLAAELKAWLDGKGIKYQKVVR